MRTATVFLKHYHIERKHFCQCFGFSLEPAPPFCWGFGEPLYCELSKSTPAHVCVFWLLLDIQYLFIDGLLKLYSNFTTQHWNSIEKYHMSISIIIDNSNSNTLKTFIEFWYHALLCHWNLNALLVKNNCKL